MCIRDSLCGLFTTTYFGGNSTIYITNNTAINDVGTVRVFETTSTAPVVLDDMLVVIEGNRVEMAGKPDTMSGKPLVLSLIHISEPTRLLSISYAVFCLKKKPQIISSDYNNTQ
eukprot:TRINITY_DN34333_c0_g1_i1.p1 TRINITY_DN34333_c0_g1~~TRINITY_DN34333_c0_g1_i1.p1  ORF type:complete len:114 (+),score=30.77 TRINITY_DN34333_c0_g1_i1:129-470(+)